MIKKLYYSTLNDEFYKSKKEAQKAEDKFIEDYFNELDIKASNKKRLLKAMYNKLK